MKFKKENIVPAIAIGLTACFLVVGAFSMMSSNADIEEIKSQTDAAKQQVAELQSDLEAPTEEKNAEVVEVKLQSIATTGNKIADLQNKYVEAYKLADEKQTDAINDIQTGLAEELPEHFSTRWFPLDNNSYLYEWKFNTTYSFSDQTIPVLWTCHAVKQQDDMEHTDLLAYVTANYNTNDDSFTSIEITVTSAGNEQLKIAGEKYMAEYYGTDSTESTENNTTENKQNNDKPNEQIETPESNNTDLSDLNEEELRRQGIYSNINQILDDYNRSTKPASESKDKTTTTTTTKTSDSTEKTSINTKESEVIVE